jgi:hypothetical protein
VDPQTIGASALIIGPSFITVRYAIVCWLKPFRTCGRCDGAGSKQTAILHRQRRCWRCNGAGKHLRAGRAAYNATRRFRGGAR